MENTRKFSEYMKRIAALEDALKVKTVKKRFKKSQEIQDKRSLFPVFQLREFEDKEKATRFVRRHFPRSKSQKKSIQNFMLEESTSKLLPWRSIEKSVKRLIEAIIEAMRAVSVASNDSRLGKFMLHMSSRYPQLVLLKSREIKEVMHYSNGKSSLMMQFRDRQANFNQKCRKFLEKAFGHSEFYLYREEIDEEDPCSKNVHPSQIFNLPEDVLTYQILRFIGLVGILKLVIPVCKYFQKIGWKSLTNMKFAPGVTYWEIFFTHLRDPPDDFVSKMVQIEAFDHDDILSQMGQFLVMDRMYPKSIQILSRSTSVTLPFVLEKHLFCHILSYSTPSLDTFTTMKNFLDNPKVDISYNNHELVTLLLKNQTPAHFRGIEQNPQFYTRGKNVCFSFSRNDIDDIWKYNEKMVHFMFDRFELTDFPYSIMEYSISHLSLPENYDLMKRLCLGANDISYNMIGFEILCAFAKKKKKKGLPGFEMRMKEVCDGLGGLMSSIFPYHSYNFGGLYMKKFLQLTLPYVVDIEGNEDMIYNVMLREFKRSVEWDVKGKQHRLVHTALFPYLLLERKIVPSFEMFVRFVTGKCWIIGEYFLQKQIFSSSKKEKEEMAKLFYEMSHHMIEVDKVSLARKMLQIGKSSPTVDPFSCVKNVMRIEEKRYPYSLSTGPKAAFIGMILDELLPKKKTIKETLEQRIQFAEKMGLCGRYAIMTMEISSDEEEELEYYVCETCETRLSRGRKETQKKLLICRICASKCHKGHVMKKIRNKSTKFDCQCALIGLESSPKVVCQSSSSSCFK